MAVLDDVLDFDELVMAALDELELDLIEELELDTFTELALDTVTELALDLLDAIELATLDDTPVPLVGIEHSLVVLAGLGSTPKVAVLQTKVPLITL